jgi:hypothetical protein
MADALRWLSFCFFAARWQRLPGPMNGYSRWNVRTVWKRRGIPTRPRRCASMAPFASAYDANIATAIGKLNF